MIHTIDAQGRSMGRVASEAAMILMGKNRADFANHKIAGESVIILNAMKLRISDKKKKTKRYSR